MKSGTVALNPAQLTSIGSKRQHPHVHDHSNRATLEDGWLDFPGTVQSHLVASI